MLEEKIDILIDVIVQLTEQLGKTEIANPAIRVARGKTKKEQVVEAVEDMVDELPSFVEEAMEHAEAGTVAINVEVEVIPKEAVKNPVPQVEINTKEDLFEVEPPVTYDDCRALLKQLITAAGSDKLAIDTVQSVGQCRKLTDVPEGNLKGLKAKLVEELAKLKKV